MKHKININIFSITREKKRHHVVGCFKLCPRVLENNKREINGSRNGNQDTEREVSWEAGRCTYIPEERYQGTLDNCARSRCQRIQPYPYTALSMKALQRLPMEVRKARQPVLRHLAQPSECGYPFPICLSSVTGAFFSSPM